MADCIYKYTYKVFLVRENLKGLIKGENMKSNGKIFQITVFSLLVILIGCMTAEAGNDRQSVVNEAYYAYSGVHGSSAPSPLTWNYLVSDVGAYWHTRDYWTVRYPVDGYMTNANDPTMRKYFIDGNIPAYGRYKGSLRGGQCKYFANLVLYRAGVSNVDPMPTYTNMQANSKSANYAKAGDVLFKSGYHTAIVTKVLKGSSSAGTVTSVEVIDSNWVGGAGNEMIGKHIYSSGLSSWKVWKGVSYYNT